MKLSLTASISASLLSTLTGCSGYPTEVKNLTGEEISVHVDVLVGGGPTYGTLAPGQSLLVRAEPGEIKKIAYAYGGRTCELAVDFQGIESGFLETTTLALPRCDHSTK